MSKASARFAPYNQQRGSRYERSNGSEPSSSFSGKREKKEFAEQKNREVFRAHYPLNNSGSKHVIIAMDPGQDFHPCITLGKPGWSGLKLSQEAFNHILENKDYISDFIFNSRTEIPPALALSATETVHFRKGYGTHLIEIVNTLEVKEKFTIARASWDGFLLIAPGLKHLIDVYNTWQGDAFQLFHQLCARVKLNMEEFVRNNVIIQCNGMLKKDLETIQFEDLGYNMESESFDARRLFYELKAYCGHHIAAYLPYVG